MVFTASAACSILFWVLLVSRKPITGTGASAGGYYVLDFDISGTRLTAELKPAPGLSFKTRYVHQRGKAAIASDGYMEGDSNDSRRHQIGETIDWNPNRNCYVQLNGNWAFNVISTIYPRAGITPATSTNIAFNSNDVVQNSNSNYVNGSLLAGIVLSRKDDLQFKYTYYHAANGNPQLTNVVVRALSNPSPPVSQITRTTSSAPPRPRLRSR